MGTPLPLRRPNRPTQRSVRPFPVWDNKFFTCGFHGDIVFRASLNSRVLPFPSPTDMYFGYLLSIFLYTLAAHNRAVARRVKILRLSSGIDEFEVQGDNRDSICTQPDKAAEFCAKHGAISVHNTRSCSNHEEALHCRCNSTNSTFLLHEKKCVNNENVTQILHEGIPGRRTMQLHITQIFFVITNVCFKKSTDI